MLHLTENGFSYTVMGIVFEIVPSGDKFGNIHLMRNGKWVSSHTDIETVVKQLINGLKRASVPMDTKPLEDLL